MTTLKEAMERFLSMVEDKIFNKETLQKLLKLSMEVLRTMLLASAAVIAQSWAKKAYA